MGPDVKTDLVLGHSDHRVECPAGPAHSMKKQKRKEKNRNAQHTNDETLQKSSVDSNGTNSVLLNASPPSSKEKGSIKKCKNAVSGLEHVNNGYMELKKKRKIDLEEGRGCENVVFSNHKRRKHHEVASSKKKKEKTMGTREQLEDQVHPDGLNQRVLVDNVKMQVNVSGRDALNEKFRPLESFVEVQAPKVVMECCSSFNKPSPIQAYAWPFVLDGRDLVGIAATGSGKTLAFGVPALVHVLKRAEKGLKQTYPTCLVLSPTRELAQQISEVLVDAGRPCGVRVACFYGGTSKKPQYIALKLGVDIIVATPGRLQDLVEEGCCALQKVSFVVLDEADRMLDLGFEEAVRALIGQTSKSRQTIMFSATWPSAVDQLAKEFMRGSPIKVIVGSQDLAANHSVTQVVEVIDTTLRDARLLELLKKYHKSERNRILVFVLYKKEAVRVENMLQRRGWNVSAVHGDKGQFDRNKAVMSFKDGTCPLLIATDVAARGLDIPDVEYVINYSFPLTTEDYVHRIGRTGRAGKSGIAHTFFTQADKARAGELVNVLKEAGQTVPSELLKFGTSVKKKESTLYGVHFKDIAVDAPKATKITFESDQE
ncbi:hypothetical protein GOP47_0002365 [Adiantum capillus-veneris]|uniref:RNA helicase n=1 Tax=Adiantum capillus-veneris TaxID=13818 RepID=A0A9D4VAJ6_ADICA|nr:hypothetical protein GOP47_0001941 [Adiantum capillus-veneris]KAI5082622.1 hypothetical protein GOP47_0002365 [Adiantum capillus-veneris]